jgi:hypothetical protein
MGPNSAGIGATFTSKWHSSVIFENLSRKWNVGLETATHTIQVTTQPGVWMEVHPLHRQYRVDHLHLNRQRLNGSWFTVLDNIFDSRQFVCSNIHQLQFHFSPPWNSKTRVAQALTKFPDDVGIPDTLLSDGAAEVTTGQHADFMKLINRLNFD